MAAETGNTYISQTITVGLKIPTGKSGLRRTMVSSNKVLAKSCYSDQQPEIAIWPSKPILAPIESAYAKFLLVRHSNFGPILHRVGDTVGFLCS